ncbi:MAG: TVP38/TMEM64 family protein [Lentisphaerae bacterium]|nr:TVP38/TMEM64 family protein [Lentisphaerota bacterium]MCP4102113.1 TVP38/TMEM64 family protein [Lentisphaerota bacterium]
MGKKLQRWIPLLILIAGLIAFFALGGRKYLSLEMLSENYKALHAYTMEHYALSVLIYVGVYILVAAFSIPGATVMTLLGGFLFGVVLGTSWVVIGATIGATITFLAVQTAVGGFLQNKAGSTVQKMQEGFKRNEFSYLLFLRLLPIFPFFIINIAAGVLGVSLRTFFFGTLLGIIPGSFAYAWVGSGLGYALSKGERINMGIIFEPQVLLPILVLAALSVIPVIYKKVKRKRETAASGS